MIAFYVWDEDQGHERADAKLVEAYDAATAAQRYAEQNAARCEWPESWDLWVENHHGARFRVHVSVEMVPKYHATVEYLILTQKVVGSIPTHPTKTVRSQ